MDTIYDTLNPEQKEAVFHTEGPLLVLAGAGSGKTRVLTHRIAYLIEEKGVNPWNILAITFTNKAAEEMRERVDRLVGFGAEQIWVATFHSTCVRILRRHIQEIGYDTNFTIYDTDDQKSIMKQVLKKLDLDPKQFPEKQMISFVSSCKNEMITPEEVLKGALDFRKKKLAEVYQCYQQMLRENNALDFDDLLMKTVELFETSEEVLSYYQNRFRYIMVDEYQDTNHVQFQFIMKLAGSNGNLCVVGDDDQSIYRFRGADITNILSFEEHFKSAHVIKLEQNYRSTNSILECANHVIRNNTGRKAKHLWSDRGEGAKVKFRLFQNGYEEAEAVLRDIQKETMGGRTYNDCAILYRTNAQSRAFEEKCIALGVPYKIIGGINFYQRQEIKDVLAYLKTVDNGLDDLAVRRIINVPKRGIGQTTVDRLQSYADSQGCSFLKAIEQCKDIAGINGGTQKKLESFLNQIYLFRAKAEYQDVAELIETVLETTGYLEELATLEEEKAKQKQENIEELINKATDYGESAEESSLSNFLEEVALVADIDSLETDMNYVVLMTLHGAKGLEFSKVYLVGMEDGLFPSYMSISSGQLDDMEEERRLCYVGITRAMDELVLTATKMRTVRGETQYNKISRFIEEIPEELLDREDTGIFSYSGSRTSSYGSGAGSYDRFSGSAGSGYGSARKTDSYGSYGIGQKTDSYASYGAGVKRTVDGYASYGSHTYGGQSSGHGYESYQRGKQLAEDAFELPKAVPSSGGQTASIQKGKSVYELPGVQKGFGTASARGTAGTLDYAEGDRVRHIKFGTGVVTEITEGKKDYEVTVEFDSAGTKRMFASFAKLKKMDS